MARIKWDQDGHRLYEGGVDMGVLFPLGSSGYEKGQGWDGLAKVEEKPTGAEIKKKYANNREYAQLQSKEEYEYTIEAFTFPKGYYECNGMKEIAPGVRVHQQIRKPFGMVYRSLIGSDTEGYDHGEKYHIVYNSLAKPAGIVHETTDDDEDIEVMSWDAKATAPSTSIPGIKPPATITIDSTEVEATALQEFVNYVYGTDASNGSQGTDPTMPSIEKLIEIFGDSLING